MRQFRINRVTIDSQLGMIERLWCNNTWVLTWSSINKVVVGLYINEWPNTNNTDNIHASEPIKLQTNKYEEGTERGRNVYQSHRAELMYQSNRSFNIPPRATPRAFEFWQIFVQIPPSRAEKLFKCPPPGKLPDNCFNFSVASSKHGLLHNTYLYNININRS